MGLPIAAASTGGGSRLLLVGPLLALGAFALFTVMDLAIKQLGGRLHVLQVMYFNSLFGLATVLVIAQLRGGLGRLRTAQPKLHVLRWLISLIGSTALFWCYPRMPLADVYAIIFTAPLLITALSVPLLGEAVGWRRWSAVGVGFIGVVVILDPGRGLLSALALLALMAAVMHALNMILVRKLGAVQEPVELLGVFGNGLSLLVLTAVQPAIWQAPTTGEWALAAMAGCIAGSGFLLLATAFRLAPAATIAPFQYSQMLYGVVAGYLVFGEWPKPHVLVGAAIIVASGLYVLKRQEERAAAS